MKLLKSLSIILLLHTFSISTSIANQVATIDKLLQERKWSEAARISLKEKETLRHKIAQSRKFLDPNCNGIEFTEIIEFIKHNPHWPEIDKIIVVAEKSIKENTKPELVLSFFKDRHPATGNGFKYYAKSAKSNLKDENKLLEIIKKSWIYSNFSQQEESDYLKQNSQYININDHIKKIEFLIWNNTNRDTSHLLKLVDPQNRERLNVTYSLFRGKPEADKDYTRLTKQQQNKSTTLYAYLKTNLDNDVINNKMTRLLAGSGKTSVHSKEWTRLKIRYTRENLKRKNYLSAYSIIKSHNAKFAEDVSDAEFLSGWIALRFLGKPQLALEHFKKMHKVVKRPISMSRALYWLGRTEAKLKNKEKANAYYKKAAKYSHTFYGQLANLELGNNLLQIQDTAVIAKKNTLSPQEIEIIKAAKILFETKNNEPATFYTKYVIAKNPSDDNVLFILDEVEELASTHSLADIAKIASHHHVHLYDNLFPTNLSINSDIVDNALTYSIIRQETLFNPQAISNKNAHGLMQLLPSTACNIANKVKIKCKPHNKLLTDTKYNVTLGKHELRDNLARFGNSYILTFAAYNAGPHKSDEWIDVYGDPRKLKHHYQIIDWIEKVPYGETRDYIQRVLENMQVYRHKLHQEKQIKLLEDIGIKKAK